MPSPRKFRLAAMAWLALQALPAAAQDRPYYIAAVSDADSHPFNAEGTEPWRTEPGTDQLSVLIDGQGVKTMPLGNSWWGPSAAIDATRDGRTIFSIESQFSRALRPEATNAIQLNGGQGLRAVDMSDPTQPRIIAETTVFPGPRSVSASADAKTLVLAAYNYPDGNIGFVSWDGSTFGAPRYFNLPGLEGISPLTGPRTEAYSAVWHPSLDVIAVTLSNSNAIRFYRVSRQDGQVSAITPIGRPVRVNRSTFGGSWTPDGRYYLVSETLWGGLLPHNTNGPPTLVEVVRFDAEAADAAVHPITNGIAVPRNAEGLTISPDGRFVATVSFGQTWLPKGDPSRTQSSVTLMSFDKDIGVLNILDNAVFDGIIPEDIKFTPDGKNIVVAVYNYEDDRDHGGIETFSISGSDTAPTLSHVSTTKIGHGAHTLLVR